MYSYLNCCSITTSKPKRNQNRQVWSQLLTTFMFVVVNLVDNFMMCIVRINILWMLKMFLLKAESCPLLVSKYLSLSNIKTEEIFDPVIINPKTPEQLKKFN